MFADSLLESSPHSGHRSAWTKVASAILQSAAIAVALAMSLLHIERMHVTPPPLSIRMTPIDQPVNVHASASGNSMSTAQLRIQELVQPNHIPSTIPRLTDRAPEPSGPPAVACLGKCEANGIISNIVGTGANIFPPSRPPAPKAPPRVSEMQLGGVVKKVIPVYPEYAKRAGVQGTVVAQRASWKGWHRRKGRCGEWSADVGAPGDGCSASVAIPSVHPQS